MHFLPSAFISMVSTAGQSAIPKQIKENQTAMMIITGVILTLFVFDKVYNWLKPKITNSSHRYPSNVDPKVCMDHESRVSKNETAIDGVKVQIKDFRVENNESHDKIFAGLSEIKKTVYEIKRNGK